MKKKILQQYSKNYIYPQVDCRTLAVTNILNFDEERFDNETVFVLCGGLDIWGIKTSEHSKIRIFITRSMDSEIRFLERLGYKIEVSDGISNKKIVELLELGEKIIIDLDRYYLPNYTAAFGSQHFGYHCCNLIGVSENEEKKRLFYAYEYLREDYYSYSEEILYKARFSKCEIHSPNARTYIIKGNGKINVIQDAKFYYKHLLYTAKMQLESPSGIAENYKKIINHLAKVKVFLSNSTLEGLVKSQLNFVKLSIQKSDASGTGYRLVQAKGLRKISELCNEAKLEEISIKWEKIANEWKEIGQKNMSTFSLAEKQIFYLNFFKEMAFKEIALYQEIINICEKHVCV